MDETQKFLKSTKYYVTSEKNKRWVIIESTNKNLIKIVKFNESYNLLSTIHIMSSGRS